MGIGQTRIHGIMQEKTLGKAVNLVAGISPRWAHSLFFKQFITPRPRPVKPAEREFLAQAEKRPVSLGDYKIQTYTWGEGDRQVLFAHGWESNAGRWRSFVPPLVEKGFKVIALDAPAHGVSGGKILHLPEYIRAMRAVFEEYGGFYGVAGHSMGGGAAVMTLTTHPELARPEKMVLMGCFNEVRQVYLRVEKMYGLTPRLRKEFEKAILRISGKELDFFSNSENAAQLHDVKGLVIHDKGDETVPLEEARAIAHAWPGAQFLESSGAGHSLQKEEIFRAVTDFFTE